MSRTRLFAAFVVLAIGSVLAGGPGPAFAQATCRTDVEPNETPDQAAVVSGEACLEGTLDQGDQDLTIWEIGPDDAFNTWTLTVAGPPVLPATFLHVFEVTSPPDSAVLTTTTSPLLELVPPADAPGPVSITDLLLPVGRYLLAVSHTTPGDPAGLSYTITIERGTAFEVVEQEPNDDPATGTPVADAFEVSGDRQGPRHDHYSWSIDGDEAQRWDIALQVPLGESAQLDLAGADGVPLDSVSAQGGAALYDVELHPGTYTVSVRETGNTPQPYLLRAAPATVEADIEPNDPGPLAMPIDDGVPARGRLAKHRDVDRFVLTVPPGDPMLRDVRMRWRSELRRTLCLLDAGDEKVACGDGDGGAALSNLLLAPGPHTLEVSGPDNDPEDVYLLRVDVVGPAPADFEAEPNQSVTRATLIDPALGMRARGGADDDVFRLEVEGDPQLWQFDLSGSGISKADLINARGRPLAGADIVGDGSTATLTDLYLVPGDHYLRVRSDGAEYSLAVTALGPPDPNSEREPNDEAARAQGYRIGDVRTGRLATPSDKDLYRFTLAAAQRIGLKLAQAPDAATSVSVSRSGKRLHEIRGLAPGEPISMDLWLEAGDHILELTPEQVSEETYELTSTRLDPFEPVADREPNDGQQWARPAPASLRWSGTSDHGADADWYQLPAAREPGPLRIKVTGERIGLRLVPAESESPGGGNIRLDREEGTFVTAEDPPLGVPLLLSVTAEGDYEVTVSAAGLQPGPAVGALPVELRWELPSAAVAAYWPDEQSIEASLELRNAGADAVELRLETVTSHHRWQARPESEVLSLDPNTTFEVPVEIVSGPDASSTDPVLVSARVASADGGQVSASTEVVPTLDAPPAGARVGWPLPAELLGGLNVASVSLGAVPGGTLDPDMERRLFDGVTPEGPTGFADQVTGNGFSVFVEDHVERLPIDMEVDLAGGAVIPIVGTIINPQASVGRLEDTPREFELLLSEDGATWESVLRGTMSPLRTDQAFVLPEPMPATHARLRIWSKYVNPGAYLSIGEWKVVALPGATVGDGPLDIADPTLGGHVVALRPFVDDYRLGTRILDDDRLRETVALDTERTFDMIVGFQDGRAAQVAQLEWEDPEASDPGTRLARVGVTVSAESPAGPWTSLGTWELKRAADGSVEPFELEAPGWVRYLRLTGAVPYAAEELEWPGSLSVIERTSGDGYLSIVGEWGYRSRSGPLESMGSDANFAAEAAGDVADERTSAEDLEEGRQAVGQVEINADVDWYRLEVPAERNTLEITLDGQPTIGAALDLFDASGNELPMEFTVTAEGTVVYRAEIEPERSYDVRVEQPPFSAVFAFDTSSSIDPFLDMVTQGMRAFLSDVRPGREAVTVVPFEEPPLVDDWQDDPFLLQHAFENHIVSGTGSSSVEAALIDASDRLEQREGARAVLLVTDAETDSFDRTPRLWDSLARTRPIVFSVHIGAVVEPLGSRQRMQAWAAVGGGHYSYPTTHGEMERAFERMATWLRRPAVYSLSYETLDIQPASLAVSAASTSGEGPAAALAPGIGVEIILDTSGSMRKKLGGKRRIDIAKASLRDLIGGSIAEGVPVAVRTFGGPGPRKKARCSTRLTQPLAPLDREAALRTVKRLKAERHTATPIAAALEAVAEDLASVDGLRSVVLITDGAESCKGDPAAAIAALRDAGVDVKLDIVGFALGDDEVKTQMAAWAAAGGGTYHDAGSAEELAASIATAVSAPFQVFSAEGEALGAGTVGGTPLELEPGSYRVEVLTEPPTVFDPVELGSGATVTLTLEALE